MIGAIIMISYGAIEAESSKSDNSLDWCYVSAAPEDRFVCLPNHENCNDAVIRPFRFKFLFQK